MIALYRAVSLGELADIAAHGVFRASDNTLEGKWFAESLEAAERWGRLLYPGDIPLQVIEVIVPENVTNQMFRLVMLDQIGPARYAEGDVLKQVNQQHHGIIAVAQTAQGG